MQASTTPEEKSTASLELAKFKHLVVQLDQMMGSPDVMKKMKEEKLTREQMEEKIPVTLTIATFKLLIRLLSNFDADIATLFTQF
jgi:hypothetical protein